jgi:hypothetical protein
MREVRRIKMTVKMRAGWGVHRKGQVKLSEVGWMYRALKSNLSVE